MTHTERPDDITLVGLRGLGAQRAFQIRHLIRDVPGWPIDPVVFRDITPLLADGRAMSDVVDAFARMFADSNNRIDVVAGMEARGFLLGAPVAVHWNIGFVPLRKAGKLPPPVKRVEYDLEYGTAAMELREGTLAPGARVLIIDDVLATGGTAKAAAELVEKSGGEVVGFAFLLELGGMGGREQLVGHRVETLLRVESPNGDAADEINKGWIAPIK
jgi:adenine phosphoribosyltransferase